MKKKSLLESNPYLKDQAELEAGIFLNVATSSAIEGVSLSAFGSLIPINKKRTGKVATADARSARSPCRKSSPSDHNSDQAPTGPH